MAAGLGLTDEATTRRRAILLPLACRSWRCPCCAIRLRARNRARAFQGAARGGRIALVTLTLDPADPRVAEAIAYYRAVSPAAGDRVLPAATIDYVRTLAWPRFRKQLAREFGRVAWLRGLELTAAGIAHVHVLIRVPDLAAYVRLRSLIRGDERNRTARRGGVRRWGAGLAERAGFGIVSDVQVARRSGDVARYVTKAAGDVRQGGEGAAYVTKGIDDRRMPKWTRRASWSGGDAAWAPDWLQPTPIAGFDWRTLAMSPATIRAALAGSGIELVDPDRLRVNVHRPAVPAGGP